MTACDKLAAVLLAAGAGTRLGGNKLETHFSGGMLGEHAAGLVARAGFGWTFAVHDAAHGRIAESLRSSGFRLIENADVARGQSHSLRLAVQCVVQTAADAMLIALADMPFVDIALIEHLVQTHLEHPRAIIASSDGITCSPPAIFPRAFWGDLAALSGDAGARALLSDAIPVLADPQKLRDIDTIEDVISCTFR